jgi:serine/threonine protein kinase
MQIGL